MLDGLLRLHLLHHQLLLLLVSEGAFHLNGLMSSLRHVVDLHSAIVGKLAASLGLREL